MPLFTRKERKSLIEEVCLKFDEQGVERLKTVGHFRKYTPLFYFHIAEEQEWPYLIVTDLFGNEEHPTMRGVRKQYQGTYDGLVTVLLTGIHDGHIIPTTDTKRGYDTVKMHSPSWQLVSGGQNKLPHSQEDEEHFDNALRYLKYITHWQLPQTRDLPLYTEFFDSTHNVW